SFGNIASLWPHLVHGYSTLFSGWAYPLLNTRRLQNILCYAPFRMLLQNLTPFIFWVCTRPKFVSRLPPAIPVSNLPYKTLVRDPSTMSSTPTIVRHSYRTGPSALTERYSTAMAVLPMPKQPKPNNTYTTLGHPWVTYSVGPGLNLWCLLQFSKRCPR